MARPLYETKVDQVEEELAGFIRIMVDEGVQSYLEIGSQYGGSLWRVANALPKGSRIVSVDLPHGDQRTSQHLQACIVALRERGYDAHLIYGDSTDWQIIRRVQAFRGFAACLIDANHTLPFVAADWRNHGSQATIVAFHDIAFDGEVAPGRKPIEVAKLWRSIRGAYRHVELVAPGSRKGIGVLWH